MVNTDDIKEVIVPIVTPLKEDESIDIQGLKRLIRYIGNWKVNGIFALGTTGEFVRLDSKQKQELAEAAANEVRGKMLYFLGISDGGTNQVLKNIKMAENVNPDVFVCSLPYYYRMSTDQEQASFFEAVVSSTDRPVLLYNMPSTTGENIHIDVIRYLSRKKNVVGIKDSSGDLDYTKKLLGINYDKDFRIIVGDEKCYLESLKIGAAGIIPSLGNIFPWLFVELYNAFVSGDIETAERLQGEIDRINSYNSLYDSSLTVIILRKLALEALGICSSRVTEPYFKIPGDKAAEYKEKIIQYKNQYLNCEKSFGA